jgi:hypothetical protein
MADERERPRYPTWVRATLVALQALGLVVGLVIGNATYESWSEPDEPAVVTTTSVVPAVPVPVPEDTLG